ncbi:MAG: peptidylprolyl isomerase [Candidatus Woesearchaeota archaeon]
MAINNKDFVQIEYTGMISESKEVFDTTDKAIAKKQGIFDEHAVFGPVTLCVGEGFVLKGLEERLIGKDVGEFEFEISPEEGFGKKSAKLIQLVPTSKFIKQEIMPMPGLQINIDGLMGTVKTVTGGRTIVDFNHPLSGRSLHYNVKVIKVIHDEKEKAEAILKWLFRLDADLSLNEKTLTIKTASLPKEIEEEVSKKVKDLTSITTVVFEKKQAHKPVNTEA